MTGHDPMLDPIVRGGSLLFGHVARLIEDTPAHQALRCHNDLSLGHFPDPSWWQCPGWRTPQGQWYTTCRPLETSCHTSYM